MSDRMQKITDESEVSTTELATVLGVSARRVQQMAHILLLILNLCV